MKKILFLSICILLSVACSAQNKKSYYYDGIELHKVKGWTVLPSKDASVTVINLMKLPFQMQIVKKGLPKNFNDKRYLEQTAEKKMEANIMSKGKTPKIKQICEVAEDYVGSIPAKYIDLIYTKGGFERIYVFNLYEEIFVITCTGKGNAKTAIEPFKKILSTFTYNPESSPYKSLM